MVGRSEGFKVCNNLLKSPIENIPNRETASAKTLKKITGKICIYTFPNI